MTLLPTPLEEAAKAAYDHEPIERMDLTEIPWADLTDGARDRFKHKATAAITAYLAQAGKEGWVMVPAKPIGWFNPWNDYHGFQQVAEEYEGGDGVYPFYADQKAHDDLAAAQNGGE